MSEDKQNPESGPDAGAEISATEQATITHAEAEPSESTSTSNIASSSQQPARKKAKGGIWLVCLVLVLILAAAGASAWFAWQYATQEFQQVQVRQSESAQALQARFSELQAANANLSDQQARIQGAMTALAMDTESQMLALAERVASTETEGAADWTLAEVEYLLRIANQRLVTSRDSVTAVEMLLAADDILRELAYPELAPVRRQLARDISALQIAGQVDTEGLFFELEALALESATLQAPAVEKLVAEQEGVDEDTGWWLRIWARTKAIFTRYVVIESNAGAPQYLVSEEQRVAQLLTIQLQIRQAQLAMLSGREALFSAVLNSASESIEQFFATDAKAAALTARLDAISRTPLQNQQIDISGSIRALSEVVDQMSRVEMR